MPGTPAPLHTSVPSPSPAGLGPHHLLPAPPHPPARAGSHARPQPLPAAPAPFTSAVAPSRSLLAARRASPPLPCSQLRPPLPRELLLREPPPAKTSEAGPSRLALIGYLLGGPAPRARAGGGARPARARASRPRGRSVCDPRTGRAGVPALGAYGVRSVTRRVWLSPKAYFFDPRFAPSSVPSRVSRGVSGAARGAVASPARLPGCRCPRRRSSAPGRGSS